MTGMAGERLDTAAACPECEGSMVRRTARRGANAGSEFWGCAAFPKCRAVLPSCSKCAAPMVRRQAKRGANAGMEFWGCSTFPKCRHTEQIADAAASRANGEPRPLRSANGEPVVSEPGDSGLADLEPAEAEPVPSGSKRAEPEGVCRFSSLPPERPSGFLRRTFALIDSTQRWFLEADEPDAADRWDKEHRMKVLGYLHDRDAGRCGLCCGEIPRQKLRSAQIEHIIPKDFVRFVLSAEGQASQGGYYRSKLHAMDNLQMAHPRCNKKKGDTADVYRWRHPEMPRLAAADAAGGRVLMLPPEAPQTQSS